MDDGTYPARVRIIDNTGRSQLFDTSFVVGNVFPVDSLPDEFHSASHAVTLPLTYFDPAPDVVNAITIAWGDGSTSSYSTSLTTFAHTYASDGIYDAVITATDEDCTVTREYRILIGETDAPLTIDDGVRVVSALATVYAPLEATLEVTAIDENGDPITLASWDLDGDGNFETDGGTTRTLIRTDANASFSAAVRVTAASGVQAEARFTFTLSGFLWSEPTKNNYEAQFRKATPDAPPEWPIHHTKQQQEILAARNLERGINVHKKEYLRAVDVEVHKEINAIQRRWAADGRKAMQVALGRPITTDEFYQLVPLAEVDANEAKIEADFKNLWLKAGEKSTKVEKIKNTITKQGWMAEFKLGRADRFNRMGLSALAVLPIIALITDNASAAYKTATFDAASNTEFQAFMSRYEHTLDEADRLGYVKSAEAHLLRESFVTWLRSMDYSDKAIDLIDKSMEAKIGLRSDLFVP